MFKLLFYLSHIPTHRLYYLKNSSIVLKNSMTIDSTVSISEITPRSQTPACDCLGWVSEATNQTQEVGERGLRPSRC